MKKTQKELISYYENQLKKITDFYKGDWRKEKYIQHAKEQLEAVKNGRDW